MEKRHLEILKSILNNYNYTFYMFGSRITDRAKKLSDIDLFYKDNIPQNTLLKLEEELEESDLPYKVDIVNYHQCDDDFKNIMDKSNICLNLFFNS